MLVKIMLRCLECTVHNGIVQHVTLEIGFFTGVVLDIHVGCCVDGVPRKPNPSDIGSTSDVHEGEPCGTYLACLPH